MGDNTGNLIEALLAVSEHLEQFEPWQENERRVGELCKRAAEEIIYLQETNHAWGRWYDTQPHPHKEAA